MATEYLERKTVCVCGGAYLNVCSFECLNWVQSCVYVHFLTEDDKTSSNRSCKGHLLF